MQLALRRGAGMDCRAVVALTESQAQVQEAHKNLHYVFARTLGSTVRQRLGHQWADGHSEAAGCQSNHGPRLKHRQKLRPDGFWEGSHAADAAKVGKTPCSIKLMIFSNTMGGSSLMKCTQTAGIDSPLRALVWHDTEGKSGFGTTTGPV